MQVWEGPRRKPGNDQEGTAGAAALGPRPPGAGAQLDAVRLNVLVLVTGVEHDPETGTMEQLCHPAGVLEDSRVARRLEEVDLGSGPGFADHHAATVPGPCALDRQVPHAEKT